MTEHRAAIGLLLLASVIWGGTFVVIKDGMASVSPELLILLRFALASVVLLPIALLTRQLDRRALRSGIILGVFLWLGFWLQTRGLLTTSPLRSAFLTALGVVFVPALDLVLYRTRIGWKAAVAALLALGGTLVLVGGFEARFSIGDTLTVLCALVFAIYLVLAAKRSRESGPIGLVFVQVVTVTILSLPLAVTVESGPIDRAAIVAIVITALLATCAAFFILMWAQARTTALEAAIILSLEPVAAGATSWVTGNEPITTHAIVGGTLIFAATILCQFDGAKQIDSAA
ncbi:MAG: DMT family transporter [Thermoanaerobaculia bacterium]